MGLPSFSGRPAGSHAIPLLWVDIWMKGYFKKDPLFTNDNIYYFKIFIILLINFILLYCFQSLDARAKFQPDYFDAFYWRFW